MFFPNFGLELQRAVDVARIKRLEARIEELTAERDKALDVCRLAAWLVPQWIGNYECFLPPPFRDQRPCVQILQDLANQAKAVLPPGPDPEPEDEEADQ